MGLKWAAVFKFENDDASTETLTLDATKLQDARGPVGIGVEYAHVSEDREDVNRSLRQTVFGIRETIRVTFEIATMTDQQHVARLVNRLIDPAYRVSASLDGGTTYRRVILQETPSPAPLGGKNIAGMRYEMRLAVVDLLDSMPSIASVDADGHANVW